MGGTMEGLGIPSIKQERLDPDDDSDEDEDEDDEDEDTSYERPPSAGIVSIRCCLHSN